MSKEERIELTSDTIPILIILRDLKSDVAQLRKLLWLRHGHDGLYGDDGEMQCSRCGGLDFKRAPVEEITAKFYPPLTPSIRPKNSLPVAGDEREQGEPS